MNEYMTGFGHGCDFVLNEIAQEQARTGSKDVLKLLMHLRGELDEKAAQETHEGAVMLMVEVLRYFAEREKNSMSRTMAEDAILAGETLLGKIT
mgnify:CR=1 FL=1